MATKFIRLCLLVTTSCVGATIASPALAQSAAASTGQSTQPPTTSASTTTEPADIVVTATRRSENLQNVPLSITALSAQSLERRAATSFFDYGTSIPNLSFGTTAEGVTSSRSIAIRGIADKNTTGFYIDDTPVSESLDPKIVDVERIEVLRGPQGTLYGARSMGGTVRLITIQPSTTEYQGRIHGSVSTTDHTDRPNYSADGAINIPLVQDRVGLRIVAVHDYEAGYFQRAYGPAAGPVTTVKNVGRNVTDGVSAAMLVKVSNNFSVTPRILYQQSKLNGFPFADVAVGDGDAPTVLRPRSFVQRRDFNVPEYASDKWYLGTFDMKLNEDFGTFTSATSYFHRDAVDTEDETDFDAFAYGYSPSIPAPASLLNPIREFTQEFRFSSAFKGPFQVITGLFYSHNSTQRYFPPDIIPGLAEATGFTGTDLNITEKTSILQKDYAAYAEGSLKILEGLKAIAGLRVFQVNTTSSFVGDGFVLGGPTSLPTQTTKEHGVQPKFSLQYQIGPGNQVYATAAKGFRPGGINGVIPDFNGCGADLAALGLTAQQTTYYKSDTVWSYEVGAKTTMLDRRVTADVGAFLIDWTDIQQRVALRCGFSFRGNAGKARSQGIELETTARIVDGLSVSAGFGYTDAKFTTSAPGTEFLKGDRIPQVPKYTLNIGADYGFPVSDRMRGFGHADYRYVSDSLSVLNSGLDANGVAVPRIRPSYNIVDLRGGVSFDKSEVAVYVKNVTNELANLGDALALAAELPGRARVSINQPRTIGVEFRSRF